MDGCAAARRGGRGGPLRRRRRRGMARRRLDDGPQEKDGRETRDSIRPVRRDLNPPTSVAGAAWSAVTMIATSLPPADSLSHPRLPLA